MTMKLRDCPTQSNVLAYACAGILCMVATVPFPAHAGAPPVPDPVLTDNTLLASAVPDECFNGVGVDYPPINSDGTCSTGKPKINESRIWGLTEESGKLWFGTLANSQCVVTGQVKGGSPRPIWYSRM